jgi:DNA-binding IclR family transcriptional regulator
MSEVRSRAAPPEGTQSVQRVFALLRVIALHNRGGLRVVDLCRITQLRRPTLYRLLQCLEHENLVVRNERTRNYHLGPMLHELGLSAAPPVPMTALCRPHLRAIADATGDMVFLTQRSGPDALCLDRQEGRHWTRAFNLDIGTRRPLGIGAGGLAILSALPPDQMRRIVSVNQVRLGEFDGLTAAGVRRMVRQTQARGFAVHDGATSGARAIGIPIRDRKGMPVAAISVSAPVQRMPAARWAEIVALLSAEAKSIERSLGNARRTDQPDDEGYTA